MSEAVTVTGTPRIAVDVGVSRYATYTSGSGSAALVFTYAMVAGDVDLDGVSLSSPIDLNGGTITDLNGNPQNRSDLYRSQYLRRENWLSIFVDGFYLRCRWALYPQRYSL